MVVFVLREMINGRDVLLAEVEIDVEAIWT